jgi:tellurite resistance protein TerB
MALWDRLKESASQMQTQLVAKKNDLKSGAFRDASMAMCALVAAADGTVDPSERQRVAQLIATNDVLQNFPADDLRRRFEENLDKLTADFVFGRVGVLQEIAKAKKKPAEARAVVQIGIVIGGADGHFDKDEQAAVREACYATSSTSDRARPARRRPVRRLAPPPGGAGGRRERAGEGAAAGQEGTRVHFWLGVPAQVQIWVRVPSAEELSRTSRHLSAPVLTTSWVAES